MVDCKKIFGDVLIKLSCSVNDSRVLKKIGLYKHVQHCDFFVINKGF
jgi:hypothetical protein